MFFCLVEGWLGGRFDLCRCCLLSKSSLGRELAHSRDNLTKGFGYPLCMKCVLNM